MEYYGSVLSLLLWGQGPQVRSAFRFSVVVKWLVLVFFKNFFFVDPLASHSLSLSYFHFAVSVRSMWTMLFDTSESYQAQWWTTENWFAICNTTACSSSFVGFKLFQIDSIWDEPLTVSFFLCLLISSYFFISLLFWVATWVLHASSSCSPANLTFRSHLVFEVCDFKFWKDLCFESWLCLTRSSMPGTRRSWRASSASKSAVWKAF